MDTDKTLSPLIRASELARRWNMDDATVARCVARGDLAPAMRCGRSTLFALADVLRIEAGQTELSEPFDIELTPLSSEARTSPNQLLLRVVLARDSVGLAAGKGDASSEALRVLAGQVLRAVDAVLLQINGGDGAHDLHGAIVGPRDRYGVRLTDPDAGFKVMHVAYAALVHLLMSMESRETLRDLGPVIRDRFVRELEGIREVLAGGMRSH